MKFWIVIIHCWFSSMSDDHKQVYLEKDIHQDVAKQSAVDRLNLPYDHIFEIIVKEVSDANLGLIADYE